MKTFSEIQKEGSEKYGFTWLKANEIVTDVASRHKLDVTKEPMKTILSEIALELLSKVMAGRISTIYYQMKSAWWQAWAYIYGAKDIKDPAVAKFAEEAFNTWASEGEKWGVLAKGSDAKVSLRGNS